MKNLLRKKQIIDNPHCDLGLRRCLTAFDLTLLGIGAVIGAGIFVLTGIAAALYSGPAIIISYLLAGLACAFSALSYAELSAALGGCGSAYGYSYVGFGEIIAWIIGWDLLLEYGASCSAVAIGWSGYVNNGLQSIGIHLPTALILDPYDGGIVNLPAMLIISAISLLLASGVKHSARFNTIIVAIKLIAIAVFIFVAMHDVNTKLWSPFMPFGWSGVVSGAALVFFAYIGFDAVSTTAEEAVNPQRDLPIAIIASLTICTLLYVVVSALLTGIVPYSTLNVSSPVTSALLSLGHHIAAGIIAVGAIAGLTTVILVMYYGFTRVFLAMARDGLLPAFFSKINHHTQTPARLILIVGFAMALVAGIMPMRDVAKIVNIGTLFAFCLVCAGVIALRVTQPSLLRTFKTPFSPTVPAIGILLCLYLMLHLALATWAIFLGWMIVGLVIYFSYSMQNSLLEK